jgi:hypothetical protein
MEYPEPISAEEGANRVAQRRRELKRHHALKDHDEEPEPADDDDASDDENEPTRSYTCENCGAYVFLVHRTSTTERTLQESLECACGATDVAAVREICQRQTVTEVGRLGPDHQVRYEDEEYGDETIEEDEWEELESDVSCDKCLEQASRLNWQWKSEELEGWQEDAESLYFELRCAECDHEIEFGWSHPDRGGRIWPCESADFNPWMCFPEQRFLENWTWRGWVRPKQE